MKTVENLSHNQRPIDITIFSGTYLNIKQGPEDERERNDVIALHLSDVPKLLDAIAEEARLGILIFTPEMEAQSKAIREELARISKVDPAELDKPADI